MIRGMIERQEDRFRY